MFRILLSAVLLLFLVPSNAVAQDDPFLDIEKEWGRRPGRGNKSKGHRKHQRMKKRPIHDKYQVIVRPSKLETFPHNTKMGYKNEVAWFDGDSNGQHLSDESLQCKTNSSQLFEYRYLVFASENCEYSHPKQKCRLVLGSFNTMTGKTNFQAIDNAVVHAHHDLKDKELPGLAAAKFGPQPVTGHPPIIEYWAKDVIAVKACGGYAIPWDNPKLTALIDAAPKPPVNVPKSVGTQMQEELDETASSYNSAPADDEGGWPAWAWLVLIGVVGVVVFIAVQNSKE